tara:strand:- start:138 stop:326 length:189 start_codon:yes stop_codon:yes gene_type:complete
VRALAEAPLIEGDVSSITSSTLDGKSIETGEPSTKTACRPFVSSLINRTCSAIEALLMLYGV